MFFIHTMLHQIGFSVLKTRKKKQHVQHQKFSLQTQKIQQVQHHNFSLKTQKIQHGQHHKFSMLFIQTITYQTQPNAISMAPNKEITKEERSLTSCSVWDQICVLQTSNNIGGFVAPPPFSFISSFFFFLVSLCFPSLLSFMIFLSSSLGLI